MNIIVADDEELAREMLIDAIKEATPNSKLKDFAKPSQLLEYAKDNKFDVAFLDIKMRGMTGVELAEKLKSANPKVNIVFVTGYGDYVREAISMHASGYIMKPVTAHKVIHELKNLRYDVEKDNKNMLQVKCFGNFEVFDTIDKPVKFERSKAKEILAYLIYLKGASCNIKEVAAVLFEDEGYSVKQRNYVQQLLHSLNKTLTSIDLESVLIKNYNSIAIDVSQINCDYYDYLNGDTSAKDLFHGEFMTQYSWAEDITGTIN